MIKIFFDGKCGLCSKEISHYKKIAPTGIFDWIDITKSNSLLEDEGIDLNEALRLLHAKDDQGNIYVGVDAFILIWQQLVRWKILISIISLPIIRPLANKTYEIFASWRFNRINHCKADFNNGENK